MTYNEALMRQLFDKQMKGCEVIKVERLLDCYRVTTRNGYVTHWTLEQGANTFPRAEFVNEYGLEKQQEKHHEK